MSEDNYRVNPVGFVRAGREGFRIEIDPAYRQALAGLEGFSHVLVLWWANLADGEEESSLLSCESPYRNGPQQMGIFSTRSPLRPNPICLSCTGLLSVEQKNGVLNLAYIDAEDGTPVLDIKPYHPRLTGCARRRYRSGAGTGRKATRTRRISIGRRNSSTPADLRQA